MKTNNTQTGISKPLKVLFGILLLWIILIAIGTVVFGNNANWQKPLIVVAPMLILLGTWFWLLKRRNERRS